MSITDKNKSTIERLKDLQNLYEAGVLTKEERDAEKAKILGKDEEEENLEAHLPKEEDATNETTPESTYDFDDDDQPSWMSKYGKWIFAGLIAVALVFIIVWMRNKDLEQQEFYVETDSLMSATYADDAFKTESKYKKVQAILEKAMTENMSITDFFSSSEISEAMQNEYGLDFYTFFMKQLGNCGKSKVNIDKTEGSYYEETNYNMGFSLNDGQNGTVDFAYNVGKDIVKVALMFDGNRVNPDGTFALFEKSKWKRGYEKDEFGDPIPGKSYLYVEGEESYLICDMKIAVKEENPDQIVLLYELEWSDIYDLHYLHSIKVKNKEDGSVTLLNANKPLLRQYTLSPEETQYLKDLCDSDPESSFSIRIDYQNSDFLAGGDRKYFVADYDNGRAYGLKNAIYHYFYRAF